MKFIIAPFAISVLASITVLCRDKHAKDLYLIFGIGSLLLCAFCSI